MARDSGVVLVTETCSLLTFAGVSSMLLHEDAINARERVAVSKLRYAILPPPLKDNYKIFSSDENLLVKRYIYRWQRKRE